MTKGRFRWVSCQLDSLRKCVRPSAVRKTLGSLPATLDETYERMLLKIKTEYEQEARAALKWLVTAQRVLRVDELAETAAIDIKSDHPFDPSNRLFDPNSILEMLSGLVLVLPGKI